MAAIKRFFEKKKLEMKFKKAGEGHKLTESTKKAGPSAAADARPASARAGPSSGAQMAAQAALARLETNKPGAGNAPVGQGASAIRLQVKRELEAERKATDSGRRLADVYAPTKEVVKDMAPMLAVSGVYYKCPMIGPQVKPRKEMEELIEQFLLEQLAEEPGMTAALMIHTLNKDAEKVKTCLDTLCKYLDNIISNPGEEKFLKIRINNKAFQDRISPLDGTNEFLQAVGFSIQQLPGPSTAEEPFYVMSGETAMKSGHVQSFKDILLAAEPIKPELDRGLRVFYPSPQCERIHVPDEFYTKSPEELKKEQQKKAEAAERFGMLRTKEMREREQLRELRKYRFALIRIRFPDGIILQGTFRATEKVVNVLQFVRENLKNDWIPFHLSTQTGQKLSDETLSLAEQGLAPAAVINFTWDADVMAEIAASQGGAQDEPCITDELLQQIQQL